MEVNQISNKDKKISLEIIRFLVTGVICAFLDFLVCYIVSSLISFLNNPALQTAIYTLCGFIVGVIANYLLSTFWVFKNVEDKNKSKSPLFKLLFVIFSSIGWLISFITMFLCSYLILVSFKIDINNFQITLILNPKNWLQPQIWLFILSFGFKTLLGMIWNYLTRKFILYKAPKENVTNE